MMRCLLLAAVFLGPTAVAHGVQVDDLEIVPAPKAIRLTGSTMPLVSEGRPVGLIVVAAQASRQAQIGADEINQQIEQLCGVRLPVKSETQLTDADRAAPRILLGLPGEGREAADLCRRLGLLSEPGVRQPQAYQIRFVDGQALLAGWDRLGLLYACVTFRHLVHRTNQGVAAYEAVIDDWPDCRWRFTWTVLRDWQRIATGWDGRFPPARPTEGILAAKAGLDWLLRHKINVFWSGHGNSADTGRPSLRPFLPEVLQYAFERGIWGFTAVTGGNLGDAPPDQPRPELDVCFSYAYDGPRHYWCWSRDAQMAERYDTFAREIAAGLPKDLALGGMFVYQHTPDTGNMGWHERCEQCRRRFGNDQAAAQANLFRHFSEAMQRHLPHAKLIFVPRPYVGFNLEFPENKVYRDRIEKLARLMPKGAYLVHVEATREAVDSWKRLTPHLQLAHWVNTGGRWLELEFRLNRTYQVDPEDMILQGGPFEWWTLEVVGAAETLWNAHSPLAVAVHHDQRQPSRLEVWHDDADWPKDLGREKNAFSNALVDGVPLEEWEWQPLEQKAGPAAMAFLQRAAKRIYGETAGPLMLQLFGAGFLDSYIKDPLGYDGGRYATPDAMARQVQAYQAAAAAAERFWGERIALKPGVFAGGVAIDGLPEPAYRFGIGASQAFALHAGLAKARVWQPLLAARAALAAGNVEAAATHAAEAERQRSEQADVLRAAYARFEARKRHQTEVSPQWLADALAALDGLQPKIKEVRAEVGLRAAMVPFPKQPFAPRYQSGKIKVGVYLPPPREGVVTGAIGLRDTLAQDPEVEVTAIPDLALDTLLRFDVLVFPSCTQLPAADLARIADVRRYVADHGGGVYAQHDSVGYPRFPVRNGMFPEMGTGHDRLDSNRVTIVREHPLVKGYRVGDTVEHMYYDHVTISVKGASGVPILVDSQSQAPVVVAGQVGRGRVVLDGSIAYVSLRTSDGRALADRLGKREDFEHAAYGFSAELLRNAIRWLCGIPPRSKPSS